MPPPLAPRNFEIHAKWDGDVKHAVEISVSVEVESEPDTQLRLLDTRAPSVSLKESLLWRLPRSDQGHGHPDAEALDDTCSKYFSFEDGSSIKRQQKDDDGPRTPYTKDMELPSSQRSRIFPPSPASAEKDVKSLHRVPSEQCPEHAPATGSPIKMTSFTLSEEMAHSDRSLNCEPGDDVNSTKSERPMNPGSSSTGDLMHFSDQGSNEQNTEAQGLADNDTIISDNAAAALSFAASLPSDAEHLNAPSRSSNPSSRALSRISLKVFKRDERSSNRLLRKRTAKDAGLSDSGSNSPSGHHIDIEGRAIHNEVPSQGLDPAPDLSLQKTRSVRRLQPAKIHVGTTIRTNRRSLIPIRTTQCENPISELCMSPTKLCEPSDLVSRQPATPKEEEPSDECDLAEKLFDSGQDDIFSERDVVSPQLSPHIMPLVPPVTPVEETYENETVGADVPKHDADAAEYQEASIDDLSLPPSPSPSSQDIMPWKSASELLDCPKSATDQDQEEKVYGSEYSSRSEEDPEVVLEDGHLLLRNGRAVRRALHKVTFNASIMLKQGSDGWLSLLIPGLPTTSSGDHGALSFDIPPDQGIEFRTAGLHASKIDHHCFQARFLIVEHLHLSFRLANVKKYTLPSFEMEQEIRADSVTVQPDRSQLSVAYHALCSLQVPGVCFWAEKCSFAVHVDGGPQGQFFCELEQRPGLQLIRLDAGGERPMGVSHLEVICAPGSLEAFGITWSVKLESSKSSTWLPRIYPALSTTYAREGNHLRRMLDNVELADDENGDEFGTYDDEDFQSTSSSEMVMYPQDDTSAAKTVPVVHRSPFDKITAAWDDLILALRRERLVVERPTPIQIGLAILVFTLYCLAGLSRIQGNHGYSPWSLENITAGAFLGVDNRQQTFRDSFMNFNTERLREAVLWNICKGAGNIPDGEHSLVTSETTVKEGEPGNDDSSANTLPTNQMETDAAIEPSSTDDVAIMPAALTERESAVLDTVNTVIGSTEASQPTWSLRDRMDYLLGWRGPLG